MDSHASVTDYIRHHVEQVEQRLAEFVPADWVVPPKLKEAMAYSLMAGGKRLRPALVLAAADSIGDSVHAAISVACAVEMIHTYSLIHDDLPAMDNDDYRRGKLTNHKMFGEAMAILAGDALLTHAFYQAAQAAKIDGVRPEQVLAVLEELSRYAGAAGMVGGQAADILGEQGITSLAELEYIHLHKTSDLIVFSLRAGGRIAGADERQLAALERYGRCIGLAFQIQDDILDIIGDSAKLGKSTKSDEKQQKVTYPYFIGLDASKQLVEKLTHESKEAVASGAIPYPQRLLQIADYLMSRDH